MQMQNLADLKANNEAPLWLSEEGYATLQKGYLQELNAETPIGMYKRLAKTAASHMPANLQTQFEQAFLYVLWQGWLSPATPVASNFGAMRIDQLDGQIKPKGLPVSCFGSAPANSIDSIFAKAHELAMLSKYGGGTSTYLGDLYGPSPVTDWARLYDLSASIVSQGGVRRGSVAQYLPIEHPDIKLFLHAKNQLSGDIRQKLDCNIAVIISDSFMHKLQSGDSEALSLFTEVLELRMKFGSPYIQFQGNMDANRPIDYKALGLFVKASNLCSEISLFSDEEHTYSCVLSSLNLAKYYEWASYSTLIGDNEWTLPMLGIAFLDAVCESFIQLAGPMPGYEASVRSAIKGRPLGLGVIGYHTLLQAKRFAFASDDAKELNKLIFSQLGEQAKKASLLLGKMLGVPEWCAHSKQRNTHLIAIAPTLANSVIANAGSAGIEPIASNAYVYQGAKGNFVRKNGQLANELDELGLNTPEVWQSIIEHDGSIQQLSQLLPNWLLQCYRTAHEIDQFALLEQAADRQKYTYGIQGQSLNLFIKHNAPTKLIWQLHIKAWKLGLNTLYYVRSTSPHSKLPTTLADDTISNGQPSNWRVHLETRAGCSFCDKAKALLQLANIAYTESNLAEGTVPVVSINGQTIGGYNELAKLLKLSNSTSEIACAGCDG